MDDRPIAPGDLPTARKFLIFGILAFGQFMALIDIQIVAASLNNVQAGLSAGPDEISWIQTGYLDGRAGDDPGSPPSSLRRCRRDGCFLCQPGCSPSPAPCAVCRGTSTRWSFPRHPGLRRRSDGADGVRHRVRALLGSATRDDPGDPGHGLGAGADPRAHRRAGWLTDVAGWRSIFYINIVPGILVTVLAATYVRVDRPNLGYAEEDRFHPPGVHGGVSWRAWNTCWRKVRATTGSEIPRSPPRPGCRSSPSACSSSGRCGRVGRSSS